MEIALGFKPHTGWAVAVLVSGDGATPVVHHRARVTLCPEHLARQVYHHAQHLTLARARRAVAEVDTVVGRTTGDVLTELVERAGHHGELVGVGIVGVPHEVPPLEAVLRSHALLHMAEGELYRGAIQEAVQERGLPVSMASPKGVVSEAALTLDVPSERLAATLTSLRADLGAPWQADHKDATAVALLALGAARWERSTTR